MDTMKREEKYPMCTYDANMGLNNKFNIYSWDLSKIEQTDFCTNCTHGINSTMKNIRPYGR